MSEMRRLQDETRSVLARRLLESANADRSRPGACERALDAMSLGVVGMTAAGAAAKAGGAFASGGAVGGVGGGGSVAPAGIAKGAALLIAKWAGLGVLGSAVALTTV